MSSPCVVPINFPALVTNPPSQPRIQYRIGRYSDFRASMFAALDRSPLLADWTHRDANDPAIALLEAASILGDILTFYQELYANEAWLGTAQWPQSITALLRLIGYRPAPGLGGAGFVAFEISGSSSVPVPSGFPFSTLLNGATAPADFETSAAITAVPALSRFTLYAPSTSVSVLAGASVFGADAANLAASGVTLKPNDRILLVADANHALRQIAVVKSVTTVLDQTIITIQGTWQNGDIAGSVTAYKLGRTFRAFGYNSPSTQITVSTTGAVTSDPVDTSISYTTLLAGFPLERTVNDLSTGITMLLDLEVSSWLHTTNVFSARTALSITSGTDSVGPLQGGVTRVAFQSPPSSAGSGLTYFIPEFVDRRTAVCHEVIGTGFPVTGPRQASVASPLLNELDYIGDGSSYELLDGRLVQFIAVNPDDTAARVEETTLTIDRNTLGDGAIAVRPLSLAPALAQFTLADFPLSGGSIVVLGNVVPMTQGKTQAVAVLGNGDARQINQSFMIPKPPLTWLGDESLTPPRAPQLTIRVNGIAWAPVDSLFPSGPKDQVYILREDYSGNTWLRFGDGVNGAVLPSGVGNVTALFRTGNAANGWRQSGNKPQANGRIANLTQVRVYDEVTGGTADEDPSHARQAAPGRVEELGRIVSLSDFEFEALAQPGVEKALALWDTQDNVPLVKVTALLSDGSAAQLAAVQAALTAANAARGANRTPVLVALASLQYVYVQAVIAIAPSYDTGAVLAAIQAALGVAPADGSAPPDDGLFSVNSRDLGEPEYASRIEGTAQNVEGVISVEVTAFGTLGVAADPATLSLPSPPSLAAAVSCAGDRLLALYTTHFLASIGDA